jgi:methionyl-tRNA formyltransferase
VRIVFAGTPDFAATALQALLDNDYPVTAVYTQPDRPAGRGRQLVPGPVKQVALAHRLPVFQPESLKTTEAQEELRALAPDVMVVAAYGLILPPEVLAIPTRGCLNIHASLLPRWRGAAPIQRAIAAGDRQTGITIMQMDKGLDTGDMLLTRTTPITDEDTGGSLHDRLAELGGEAIVAALKSLQAGELKAQPQDNSQACYAHKLSKQDGHINWQAPARDIHNLVRAFNPWPGTYTDLDNQRIRIHQTEVLQEDGSAEAPGTILRRSREGVDVRCGEQTLRILCLQLPGSRAQSVNDLINGGRELLLPGQELH